jgi:hypothetical protein
MITARDPSLNAREERGTSDDVGVEGLEPPTSAL